MVRCDGLLRYDEWNLALAERFFGTTAAYVPVRLDIDEGILGELAGTPPDAATRSFVEAVARTLSGPGAPPLEHFDEERTRWRLRGQPFPPPFIGLSGLLSLAANRMRSADGYRASNYYTRLAELLRGSEPDSRRLAAYFRQHGDLLSGYWRSLNAWLEAQGGARGLPTAFPFGAQVHVSRALSQALVRAADRDSLARAFLAEGLSPGEDLSPPEMGAYISSWSVAGKLSTSLARLAEDAEALIAIADEARDFLLVWDGETPRGDAAPEGETEPRTPRLVLRSVTRPARPPQWIVTLAVRDDHGRHEGEYHRRFDHMPAGRIAMVPSFAPGWTEVDDGIPLADVPRSYALTYIHARDNLEWGYDRPLILSWDDDLNGYLEAAHGVANHEHVVLALSEDRAAALELLRRHDPDAESAGSDHQGGWMLSKPFLLKGGGGDGARLRLVGGLRLPGRNTYHVESPPDIEVEGVRGGERLIVLSPASGGEPLVNEELEPGVSRIEGAALVGAKEGLVWVRVIGSGASEEESRLRILAQLRMRLGSASMARGIVEPTMGYDLRTQLVPGSVASMPDAPGFPFVRGGELQTDEAAGASPAPLCWPGLERKWEVPLTHYEAVRTLRLCPDCGNDVRILRTAEQRGESPSTSVWGKCRPVQAGPDGLVWSSPRPAGEYDIDLRFSEQAHMDLDVLLDAMSLIGRGSMLLARRLVTLMSADAEAWIADNAIRLFESLGHVEIQRDPLTNQPTAWFVTPPTLSPLPEPGRWVLSGFRSAAFVEELRREAEMLGCSPLIERSDTVSTIKLAPDSPLPVQVLHRRFGSSARTQLRLSEDVLSRGLLARLPMQADTAMRLPKAPPPSLTAAAYDVAGRRWDESGHAPSPLRRVGEFPRRYVIAHDGSHRYVDVRSGKYLAAAMLGVSYLRYDEENMVLSVPERAELPSLFERIAVMSSGTIPTRAGGRVRYPSVPGDIAWGLGDKLGMRLERSE